IAAWSAPAGELDFEVVRVTSGLTRPVYLTAAPGDAGRVFIVEQHGGTGPLNQGKPGKILLLDLASGDINETSFLEIPGVSNGDEQGLLGLAFHPQYATNGYFYVNYTQDGKTLIRRFEVSADPDVADASSETPVMGFAQTNSNHNGGWIGFGPDGYLYISSGDGGASYDSGTGHGENGNAQNILTGNVLGKILRIDVDNDDFPANDLFNYAVPDDNPFVEVALAEVRVWVYGLRNPWRASFDRVTGDLWIGDVGQGTREEIDFQPADSPGGENYGWRLREGTIPTPRSGIGGDQPENGINPIQEYTHQTGCSVTGGYVYRGPAASIQGDYFYADYCAGNIWSLRYDGSDPEDFDGTNFTDLKNWTDDPAFAPDEGSIDKISSFGEDEVGNLYIIDLGSSRFPLPLEGEVFRIQSVPEPAASLAGALSVLCVAALKRGRGPDRS
ncbi:MAG: PQQ-dependent sugar dehydrogenase, partial [Deltaproteobacteria bacterium]|nr:PQQ-dependent sugar dehydrogenase [Deltaproteobacteria bacterium]